MTKVYDVYGFGLMDLDSAMLLARKALGLEFVLHESDYRGVYYRHGTAGPENFIIQKNYDSFEDEWTDEKHQEHIVLLYVNETPRADELRSMLLHRVEGIKHLQRRSF